jgi:Zn-dependent protease with chaperone function
VIVVAGAALLIAAIGVPHLVRLDRAPPGFAAAIWLSALLLRALASTVAVIALQIYVPVASWFAPLGAWCFDAGAAVLSGHGALDVMLALPALVLAGSLIWVILGLWRTSRDVQRLLRSSAVGPGPGDSVILADGALVVAVAGLRRPQVVVSAGALVELDDEELFASLEHERGHIALRHRYVVVAAELARAIGRFLPGTAAAARELVFALERDADRYAVSRHHDPAVLASAICKAARGGVPGLPTLALGGGVVVRRARLLLEAGAVAAAPRAHLGLVALAPIMVALVAASAIALPFVAHAEYHRSHDQASELCAQPHVV